jgi:hypothetical protein
VWNPHDDKTGEISMTSEDDKTVHQQSITKGESILDSISRRSVESAALLLKRVLSGEARHDDPGAGFVLLHEVRRLREENGEIRAYNSRLAASCAESIKERDALRKELAAAGAGYVAKLDKLAEGYISDRRVLRAVMGDHLAKLRRVEALPAKWRDDLAKLKATAHPTWQIDPTALIERATAAFCEELEAALRD